MLRSSSLSFSLSPLLSLLSSQCARFFQHSSTRQGGRREARDRLKPPSPCHNGENKRKTSATGTCTGGWLCCLGPSLWLPALARHCCTACDSPTGAHECIHACVGARACVLCIGTDRHSYTPSCSLPPPSHTHTHTHTHTLSLSLSLSAPPRNERYAP